MKTLYTAELIAFEEAKSYLDGRYDMVDEFRDLKPFSMTSTYYAGDRCLIDFASFSATASYVSNQCVSYNNYGWILATSSFSGTFSESAWTKLGNVGDIYNVILPYPKFDENSYYVVGDKVTWDKCIWTSLSKTLELTKSEALQYGYIENLPSANVLPNSRANNTSLYWVNNGTYSVTGVLPTDSTKWDDSDNRSKMLVSCLVQMSLFYLNKSISPMNVPAHRVEGYKASCNWLKDIALGKLNAVLPVDQPEQGIRFKFFGPIRKNWRVE